MVRFFLMGCLTLTLLGCAATPTSMPSWPPGGAPVADYDFNWRLSGDPMVAPLQVFSGAGRIWLQFAPGHTPAALFAQTPDGMQPLPYQRQDPYIVIEGTWPALVLRGGRYAARAQHVTQGTEAVDAAAAVPATPETAFDALDTTR